MPKISVIVPVYGVEKYIERCAESLFAQTLDEIEFIFIDDCTPDKSMSVLDTVIEKKRTLFAEKKWQIRTVRMPVNSGLPAVRRHGIQLATGQFVIACDSDDYIDKDMYKNMYDYAIANDLDLVHCDIDIVDGKSVISVLSCNKEELTSEELRNQIIDGVISNSLCNKLVKRSIYLENNITYPVHNMDEDNVIAIQLALFSRKLGYLKQPYYHAFLNTESTSRKVGEEQVIKRYNDSLANSRIIVNFLSSNGYAENSYAILRAKNRPKMTLWPVLNKKNARLWRNTYSEINNAIILNKRFSIKIKLIYIIILTHLYPFYNYLVK